MNFADQFAPEAAALVAAEAAFDLKQDAPTLAALEAAEAVYFPALTAAIQAAAAYGESEDPGVQIVAARSADLAYHWFVVEGRRKSFRRIYVVALRGSLGLEPVVVEVMGGSRMNDEALILTARRAIEGGLAVGGGSVPAT